MENTEKVAPESSQERPTNPFDNPQPSTSSGRVQNSDDVSDTEFLGEVRAVRVESEPPKPPADSPADQPDEQPDREQQSMRSMNGLHMHILDICGEKLYFCKMCKVAFHSKELCIRHLKKFHVCEIWANLHDDFHLMPSDIPPDFHLPPF